MVGWEGGLSPAPLPCKRSMSVCKFEQGSLQLAPVESQALLFDLHCTIMNAIKPPSPEVPANPSQTLSSGIKIDGTGRDTFGSYYIDPYKVMVNKAIPS